MNGLTLSEMSEKLDIPVNTLRQRITRLKIKPISQEAVYSNNTLEILKSVKMGRPKKPVEPEKPVKNKVKKVK